MALTEHWLTPKVSAGCCPDGYSILLVHEKSVAVAVVLGYLSVTCSGALHLWSTIIVKKIW